MTHQEISRLEDELRGLGEQFDKLVNGEKDPFSSPEVEALHKKMTALEKKLKEHARKKVSAAIDSLKLCLAKLKDIKGVNPGEKDFKRMQDIVTKSQGDNDKIIQHVMNMAKAIDKSDKAYRRGEAALAILPPDVAERAAKIFFARADYLAD